MSILGKMIGVRAIFLLWVAELLGRVTEVGDKVTKFKVGDICAVGCFIDACLDCANCKDGEEQYCMKGMTGTYNGTKQHGRVGGNQETKTAGGYSAAHTVHEILSCTSPREWIWPKLHPFFALELPCLVL